MAAKKRTTKRRVLDVKGIPARRQGRMKDLARTLGRKQVSELARMWGITKPTKRKSTKRKSTKRKPARKTARKR